MPSGIWSDIGRRLASPSVYVTLALALSGLLTWIAIGMTYRSSTSAGMLFPSVILPGLTGVAWITLGAIWLRRGPDVGPGVRCARCNYDLAGLQDAVLRCPECGETGVATSKVPTGARILGHLPGVICLVIGTLLSALSLFTWVMISSGVFDI